MNFMELRDLVKIFLKSWKTFFGTVGIFVVTGFAWYVLQPETYKANVTLNVTRMGTQQTTEYRYDGFYRLQADERFADTVVQWLRAPNIIQTITERAQTIPVGRSMFMPRGGALRAERLSSQMIAVTYQTADQESAARVAKVLVSVIDQESTTLNETAQEESWFTVIGDDPVIRDGRVGLALVLAVSLIGGVFIGFWAVLFRHYFRE